MLIKVLDKDKAEKKSKMANIFENFLFDAFSV